MPFVLNCRILKHDYDGTLSINLVMPLVRIYYIWNSAPSVLPSSCREYCIEYHICSCDWECLQPDHGSECSVFHRSYLFLFDFAAFQICEEPEEEDEDDAEE